MSSVQGSSGKLYGNQFQLKKKISSGSFGVVYMGHDTKTKDYVAIKIEKKQAEEAYSLEREIQILRHLQGIPSVPKLFWDGQDQQENILIIQLLGRDLTYFLKQMRKFSLKCVINIADQLLTILENIHKRSIIHRDLKPENVLVGREQEIQTLYLVDYGISKFYREGKGQHIQFKTNKPFLGTTRYASIAAHKGQELSRKDDLESLGYMLIFLLKGTLPWSNIQSDCEQDKLRMVGEKKMKTTSEELCNGLPEEFLRYMDYVKKLNFKSTPDYKYVMQLFKKLANSLNFQQFDKKFDWIDENALKKKARKKSQEPATLHSSQQFLQSNLSRNLNESEMGLGSSMVGYGAQSQLKLPENKQFQSSLLTIDKGDIMQKSNNSFCSQSQQDAQDASVMVDFQPSMLANLEYSNSYDNQISPANIYSPIKLSPFNMTKKQVLQGVSQKQNQFGFKKQEQIESKSRQQFDIQAMFATSRGNSDLNEQSIRMGTMLNQEEKNDLEKKIHNLKIYNVQKQNSSFK